MTGERRRTFAASKQTVADERKAAEVISDAAPEKTKDSRGRKPDGKASKTEIAAAVGISERTLVRAEHHVETAEEFPFMQGWRTLSPSRLLWQPFGYGHHNATSAARALLLQVSDATLCSQIRNLASPVCLCRCHATG